MTDRIRIYPVRGEVALQWGERPARSMTTGEARRRAYHLADQADRARSRNRDAVGFPGMDGLALSTEDAYSVAGDLFRCACAIDAALVANVSYVLA